jgi:hypothetical protein
LFFFRFFGAWLAELCTSDTDLTSLAPALQNFDELKSELGKKTTTVGLIEKISDPVRVPLSNVFAIDGPA